MTTYLSILNHKGGVGKTTTTVNVAVALARLRKKVLVIDNDPQADASRKLLRSEDKIDQSLFDIYNRENFLDISPVIYDTVEKNVHVIPNTELTSALEIGILKDLQEEKAFCVLSDALKGHIDGEYEYVIIDNPPSWSVFTYNSLTISTFVIVPIEGGSSDSVNGVKRAFEMIKNIKSELNTQLRFMRVLINNLDRRTTLGKKFFAQILNALGTNMLFETSIPYNAEVQKAESFQEPVMCFNPSCAASKGFRSMAKEIVGIVKEQQQEQLKLDA